MMDSMDHKCSHSSEGRLESSVVLLVAVSERKTFALADKLAPQLNRLPHMPEVLLECLTFVSGELTGYPKN